MTDVRTTGGGLPVFIVAVGSRGEVSVLMESVSMPVIRRGVKKFAWRLP
jgi:hypothetical protein